MVDFRRSEESSSGRRGSSAVTGAIPVDILAADPGADMQHFAPSFLTQVSSFKA
jgi:hypothetical protein